MLFQVEYKPQVSLTADRQELYEGDSVKMRCEASAWPALVEFSWQVGGEEAEEARGATELILQADRRLAGQRVTCLARNKIGQASADYRLDIHCKISLISQSLIYAETHHLIRPARMTVTTSSYQHQLEGSHLMLTFSSVSKAVTVI